MKLNKIQVLSKQEIDNIHVASLQLFENVGIKIDDEKARNLCQEYGAIVDKDSKRVKFPESMIKEQLRNVPSSFALHGPDGTFKVDIDVNATFFTTIGAAVKMYDPTRKSGVRKSTLDDNLKNLRLVDMADNLSCSQIDFWPGDVKYTTIHAHAWMNWVKNSRKPYGHGCFGKVVSLDAINMASIIVGGTSELIRRPRVFGIFNPTSPLHLPKIMTNGLEVFAKFKQPVVVAPEALAGTSAPVTLSGLLVQTNVEILAGIVLAQLYYPQSPVFYGSVSHVTDMRTGNSAIGSIETSLITTAVAQLAQHYKIPSRGIGAVTDSKCLDLQNGYERFQTLLFAALSGINFITCASSYEATLAGALELTVIDDELAGMVYRAMEGIRVDDIHISLDTIEEIAMNVDHGKTFLGSNHTRKYMKDELYIPILADRNRRTAWNKKGMRDIIEKASERVQTLLTNFKEYPLSSDVEKDLSIYLKEVESRPFEYYVQAEELSVKDVKLPG